MTSKPLQSLSFIEAVRLRPGMYIGSIGLRGFTELLKQVFGELQEYVLTNSVFEIGFYPDNCVRLELRNFQTGKFSSLLGNWHKSDPFTSHNWIKALIALSGDVSITTDCIVLIGKQGDYETKAWTNPSGVHDVIIDFTLDPTIFKSYKVTYDHINPFLQQFAYLNPELKIISTDHTNEDLQRRVFYFPRGIFEQMEYYMEASCYPKNFFSIYLERKIGEYEYRIAICTNKWQGEEQTKTFAGNTELIEGGSLNDGIIQGLISAIKELADNENLKIHINRKELKKSIAFMAAVKGKDFIFQGCTRTKLGMPQLKKELQREIHNSLMAYSQSDPEKTNALVREFILWDNG